MPRTLRRILALVCATITLSGAITPAAALPRPNATAAKSTLAAVPIAQSRSQVYRSSAGRHKLMVTDPATTAALRAQGAALVGDYGSFQIFDAPSAIADALVAQGAAELRDQENLILLNAGAIDTTTPAAAALRGAAGNFSGKRMRLIQFAGPIQPAWYDSLLKTGVEVVTAIPSNAYLVYGDSSALKALDALAIQSPSVQWAGSYLDTYRVHPDLRSAPTPLISVQLFADPAENAATLALIDSLRQGDVARQEVLHYINLVVPAAPAAIAQIAARPDVVSIQPYILPQLRDESQNQIIAGNVTATGPVAGDYLAQLATWGFTQAQFTASGFVVDVTDSGLDNGTTTPNHFGLFVGGVRPGTSRVSYSRLQGTPSAANACGPGTRSSDIRGMDGHGTLNAHIVGGFVPSGTPYDAFPYADANDLRYGLGVAPFVRVGASVIFDPDCFTFPDYEDLQSAAYQDGARISTNSWGADVGGAYNTDSQAYDALVRDAQPAGSTFAAPGNQQMVILFSAGNAGAGSNTIGSPGTGKNVLTIGASEGVQPIGGADGSGVDDTGADNYNDIIGFSSRGPTDDGRQKPDLVAPGTHVTGGLWQAASPGANGTADPGFTGSGVSGGTGGSPFVPAGQQWYTASSGTSHSTPAVAGGAALVRQYFINQGLDPASPAMTKAFMMSTARYLTGLDSGDTLPSPNQGMGLLDLGHAFDTTPQILRDQVAADTFTASGQSRTIVGTISDPTKPLRVTLAWTDAPGPTTGSAFLNNLDLEVTISGQTYRGNVFTGANSTTGGSPDLRNNVESVFLPAGIAAGTPFSIRVVATNIIADGVPNSGGALDQDYALVASNAVESPTAAPVLQFGSMSLVSEGFLPANGVADPGETVAVALSVSNRGTAAFTNLTVALQSGDATILDASQGYGAIPAGGSASRTFRLRVSPTAVCGGAMTLIFDAQEGAESLGTQGESLGVGAFVPSGTATGANATALSLPNGAPGTTSGAASLYPSNISIGPALARVASVSVTLTGLAHTFPSDLEVLLVGPGGQRVTLMSDAGGGTDISGVNLTFEDGAAALPTSTVLTSGTYAPANYSGGTDVMPAPAPAGPYAGTLSIFNGTNPNGTWSLYISDSESGDVGSLAGGWSLSIGLEAPVCAAAGVSGTPTSGLSTREIGGTATFDVVLNRAPSADVTIAVSSGDTGEGTVSPSSLTFTPANWYIPQSVTVTGVFDGVPDGDQPYTVAIAPAVSSDLTYSGFDALDISITSLDSFRAALPLVVRVP